MSNLFLRNQLCIPIKGYNRAIIYDIGRKDYFFIPKEYFAILDTNDFIKFDKIKDDEEREQFKSFLIDEEIVFEVYDINQKKRFKTLERKFETPNLLSNVVVNSNINPIFFDFIKDEYLLNLSIIAPRLDDDLYGILDGITVLEVDSVYLYIENFDSETFEEKRKLLAKYNAVFSVNFFNAIPKTELHYNIYFNFFDESFSTYKSKLTVDKLGINSEQFLEAYNNHSYYHGKVYIDINGNVKNGLNNSDNFGNISEISVEKFKNIISSFEFREVGAIKKAETLVCRDCEFRYMCVDSRVPIKGENIWYHQTECSYNPYLSKWNHEENYLNLRDSGIIVSDAGCAIDKNKLSQEFNKIWAE